MDGVPSLEKAEADYLAVPQAEPLKNECQHFIDVVNKRAEPLTDGIEGLSVLRSCLLLRVHRARVDCQGCPYMRRVSEKAFIHESSYVDDDVSIGPGTKVWHFSHVMSNCNIGRDCSLGQNVVIGPHVSIGDRVKIQNNVSVYEG